MPARRASTAALAAFVVTVIAAPGVVLGDARPQTPTRPAPVYRVLTPRGYEVLILAIDRLLAVADYPPQPNDPNLASDRLLLSASLSSDNVMTRAIAVRGVGQFQEPANVPNLIRLLDDESALVKQEARYAIVQSLSKVKGAAVLPAMRAFQAHGAIDVIGLLSYDDGTADALEQWLIARDVVPIAPLVDLARRMPTRRLSAQAAAFIRKEIRELPGALIHSGPIDALAGLLKDDEEDRALLVDASKYNCLDMNPPPQPLTPECGWFMRMNAVNLLNAQNPALAEALDRARHDAVFQVRITALRRYGVDVPRTGNCAPLVEAIADKDELYTIVKIEAVRLLLPNCKDLEKIVEQLKALVPDIDSEERGKSWHLPAAALEALALLAPESLASFLDKAAHHAVWQVRASAARMAAIVKNEPALLELIKDDVPNVQTEALTALAKIHSRTMYDHAQRLLENRDYEVVLTAANVLRSSPTPAAHITELLHALARITAEKSDTSRDTRVAILETLVAYGPKSQAVSPLPLSTIDGDFVPYLKDFDPKVADAAADVLEARKGVRPKPSPVPRPVEQPTKSELDQLATVRGVTVHMTNGDEFDLNFLWDQAPLASARFLALAKKHYFDGLTFHRVVPLFVVQGGSPHANEYSGQPRYQRDEIGTLRHLGGSVGVSTRGRNTGDAQLFIDLLSQPRLDYLYTIFARIGGDLTLQPALPAPQHGMAAVNAMLEGATIARVVVK